MGKHRSRNYERETEQVQRFKQENKVLKREIALLRKELSRLEQRFIGLDDLIQQQYDEENPKQDKEKDKLKEQWKCFKCKKDYLRIIVINRPDGPHYLRRCSCGNKTKLKKYSSEVKGIMIDAKLD